MNKKLYTLCAIAAAFVLAGCQKENNEEATTYVGPTHTVTFTAEKMIDTKTAIDTEGNGVVSYKWIDGDKDRMQVLEYYEVEENGETTQKTNVGTVESMNLTNDDKTASFEVTFSGTAPTGAVSYQAAYAGSFTTSTHNPKIPSEQSPLASTFDPNADVLVSDIIEKSARDASASTFRFNMTRKVSVNKMTLKGLPQGETISTVTFESDKIHAGSYGLISTEYNSTTSADKKLTFTFTENNTIPANGQFPIYFTTVPVSGATFTVTVTTNQHRYTKTSAKTISFATGEVRRFGVDLTGCEAPEGRVFTLVTDASQLSIGSQIVIAANGSKDIAMSTTQAANNRPETAATKNSDFSTITTTEQVQIFTLLEGTTSGTYAFSFDDNGTTKYLYAVKGSNYLRSKSTLDATASWSISISDNEASISATIDSEVRYLRYNSSSKIFSGYTSGQQTVYLYQASALPDPGMSWSSSTATALITSNGTSFTAPTLTLGNASNVTYSSSEEGVATIANDGTVTIVGEGETVITASFAGNANYKPATASYTLTVTDNRTACATPTFNPAAGAVASGTVVNFASTTTGVTFYYTTDGSNPTTASDSGTSVTINAACTIKVIAVKSGYKNSEVASAAYTISNGNVSIATILADNSITSSNSVNYEVSGVTVMAAKSGNYVIADATGVMLMYSNVSPALTVGSQYDVQGAVKLFNGVHEFNGPTVQSSTGTAPAYGTPETMTVSSLTSYASTPVTKYAIVNATTQSSGFLCSDGTNTINVYDGTGTWSQFYGKAIKVTGYLIGFYNSKINMIATAIEEDTTIPTLSVDPSSLSWAASETDSKTLTVTLNGSAAAGDYSYSVTSGTANDWTITKSNGTLTVAPKAANTSTENVKSITIKIAHNSDSSVYKEVTCTQAKKSSGGGTPTLQYTLTPVATGGNVTPHNSYTAAATTTIDGIEWSVMGNSSMVPWRIGGKSISSVNRSIYSTTAISANISQIVITHGGASSITVNSMKVYVCSTAAGAAASTPTNVVASFTPTFVANGDVSINKADNTSWANCYYRIVYNVTVSGSSNKFLEFKEAKFYGIN